MILLCNHNLSLLSPHPSPPAAIRSSGEILFVLPGMSNTFHTALAGFASLSLRGGGSSAV